jgi:hypothetical protein
MESGFFGKTINTSISKDGSLPLYTKSFREVYKDATTNGPLLFSYSALLSRHL